MHESIERIAIHGCAKNVRNLTQGLSIVHHRKLMPAREVRVDPQRNGQQLYLWSEFRSQAERWTHRVVDDVVVEAIAGNTDASLCERSDAWRFAVRIDLDNGEVAG